LILIGVAHATADTAEEADLLCEPIDGGSAPAPGNVSLFLVADSQFHELRGERSGGHLELVDDIVPVATRPIELDLLSEATLIHFARVYEALKRAHPDMRWAHL